MWIPVAPRSLQEVRQLQFFQLFMKRFEADGDGPTENSGPSDGSKSKKKVVRMLKVRRGDWTTDCGRCNRGRSKNSKERRGSLAVA